MLTSKTCSKKTSPESCDRKAWEPGAWLGILRGFSSWGGEEMEKVLKGRLYFLGINYRNKNPLHKDFYAALDGLEIKKAPILPSKDVLVFRWVVDSEYSLLPIKILTAGKKWGLIEKIEYSDGSNYNYDKTYQIDLEKPKIALEVKAEKARLRWEFERKEKIKMSMHSEDQKLFMKIEVEEVTNLDKGSEFKKGTDLIEMKELELEE